MNQTSRLVAANLIQAKWSIDGTLEAARRWFVLTRETKDTAHKLIGFAYLARACEMEQGIKLGGEVEL